MLTGALMVGDSVRGSLQDLALDRLGRIDRAMLSQRYFDSRLAGALRERVPGSEVAPAILLRGSAIHASTGARASSVNLLGVEERFAQLLPVPSAPAGWPPPAREPGRPFAAVVINQSLARELGAAPGDPILLTFPRGADAPPDTLLGRRETERLVGSTRCEVAAVIPDRGAGGFALSAHQSAPLNAYVRLEELQRAAERPGRVNALFVAPDTALKAAYGDEREIDAALREALDPDDLGLIVSRTPERVTIEGRDFVLRPAVVDAVERIASELQTRVQRVSTYLAIELRYRDRAVPYSTIAAISRAGHPFAGLFRPGGSPARPPAEGEILLNEWTMRELAAHPGDSIEMQYFVVGDGEQLVRRRAALTLAGEATMDGLGADPDLTPDYPGIKEARDIRAWDPPFPVELDRIRPADEAYWDTYGAAPKAFIGEETARSLWSNRYGIVTSLRLAPAEGEETAALEARLRRALVESLPLNLFGLEVRDLRAEATRAAEGTTDFGALFLGFSMFLIASSVLLAGLLFRLGVERRAVEIGLLLAVGLRERAVRRRFLAEGSVLAAIGCTLGCALGAAYAGLMMAGLRTLWRPAVGSSDLTLHLEPATLVAGSAASMLVVLLTIGWSVRSLARLSVPGLLAGRLAPESGRIAGRLPLLFGAGGTGLAAALLAWAMATGKQASPALSFGIGVCLLAGGLGWFARWCRSPGRRALSPGRSALAAMAARNMGWSPGRSILSASMIACASFVIVTVAVSRRAESSPDGGRDSPAGGFSLIAESRIPIHHDLSTRAGREGLDLPEEDAALLDGARIVALRSAPGDDASCLNLYRPDRPRLLGAPPEMVRRGGFRFQGAADRRENPWTLLEEPIEPGVLPAIGDANSVQWILHSGLGQDLELTDESGRQVRLRFVALLSSSPFQSEVILSEADFMRHFGGRGGYGAFLIEAPPGSSDAVARALEGALGHAGFDATSTMERIAAFHRVENTYLSTFQVLGGLGLLLGTLGLGVVVLRNILERRFELAALRAIGFARRRLARMLLMENLMLFSAGLLAGAGAGMAAVAPRLAAGAVAPDWPQLAATLAGVAAAGALSTGAAAAGALRAPLIPALKQDR